MGILTLTVVGSIRKDMTVELLIREHEDVVSEGNPVVLHNSCQLSSKQPRALVQVSIIFLQIVIRGLCVSKYTFLSLYQTLRRKNILNIGNN